jgi:hypothetical protein
MGIGRNESPCIGLYIILSQAGTSAQRLQVNILPHTVKREQKESFSKGRRGSGRL